MGYWHKDKHTDQGNRFQWNRDTPHIYGHLLFITGTKIIEYGKTIFSTNGAGTTAIHTQKNDFKPLPHTIKKKNNLVTTY